MKKIILLLSVFLTSLVGATQTSELWIKTDSIVDESGTVWFKLEPSGINFSGGLRGDSLFIDEIHANKFGDGNADINTGSISAGYAYLGGDVAISPTTYFYGSDGASEVMQLVPYQAPIDSLNFVIKNGVGQVQKRTVYSYTYNIPFDDNNYSLNINIYGIGGNNVGFSLQSKTQSGFSVFPNDEGVINFTAIKIIL